MCNSKIPGKGEVIAPELAQKMRTLENIIAGYGRVAVAFSGGVDSTFLLKVAALSPSQVVAITARALVFPAREAAEATALAQAMGVEQLEVEVDLLGAPLVRTNPPDRCYHCKKLILTSLLAQADELKISTVVDGSNLDDDGDYRPGARAVQELGVLSPLKKAGMTKDDIRKLSASLGLPTWNKPAYACLASRIPHGEVLSPKKLLQVEEAEDYLHDLGFGQVRVRHHGAVARLEVESHERGRFLDEKLMDQVHQKLKSLGFGFVALDLAGYQVGSLNPSGGYCTAG